MSSGKTGEFGGRRVVTGERTVGSLIMDVPGILCKHGCSYMACRGLVLTPIRGILIITHGPVGCSYYSWGGNRLRYQPENAQMDYYSYSVSTGMDESDIIFGGEARLKQAIKEAVEIFNPPVIAVCSTCPIGLIGDDVESIAREAEAEYGIQVLPFACEGFRSVPGYRLATRGIMERVMGSGEQSVGKYPVNIIGELYNGSRAREIARIFEQIGYDIVAVLMGDGNIDDLRNAHKARLNLFTSDKAVADLIEVMQKRFGTAWMGFNFIGMDNIGNSLRNMAEFFDSPELWARTEALITEETGKIKERLDDCKKRLRKKVAVLFEDEFVSRHYQALLYDLEVNPVVIGHDLLRRSGQNEMGFLSTMESSCTANQENNTVHYGTDFEHYHISLPVSLHERIKERSEVLFKEHGPSKAVYESLLISQLSRGEVEHLLDIIQADIYFPGIKENFSGIGEDACFFKADDYRFDYGGFDGAVRFAHDLLMTMDMTGWRNKTSPWKLAGDKINA
ncbi:MAG: nitrogenase component 1 [Syntrophomonadaceae bacterium]